VLARPRPAIAAVTWLVAALLGGGSALGEAPRTAAQPMPPVNPGAIDGRTFGGLRIPAALPPAVVPRDASFAARRAWSWSEPGSTLADGRTAPPVRRLLLEGDVRVRLGTHEFTAARALVWMQALPPGDPDAGPNVRQVYVYFDRVSTPRAAAGLAVSANRLGVQGVFEVNGGTVLKTDVFERRRAGSPLLAEGEAEFAQYLRSLLAPGAPVVAAEPELERVPDLSDPAVARPALPGTGVEEPLTLEDVDEALPEETVQEPIFSPGGVFALSPGEETILVEAGEQQPDYNVVIRSGGVVVQYVDPTRRRTFQASAERTVVFLDPIPIEEMIRSGRLEGDSVQGLYLEGDVMVTDGTYTLRSPRIYYDVRNNRAVTLDAVFWTYDRPLQMPLYLRARLIRQESADQFAATRATLTNTAFFEPHISLGTSSVTLTRRRREDKRDKWIADARNITTNIGPVPVLWWPIFYGDPRDIPIRDLAFESSSVSGAVIRTGWDVFSLLGLERPDGVRGRFLFDGYFERGLGLGFDFDWRLEDAVGRAFVYGLPNDTGTDQLSSGVRREVEGEFRGIATAEHRQALGERWTISAEGSYISDENFVEEFFPRLADESRELITSLQARYLAEQSGLTAEVRGSFNDFIANEYLLQSQGFNVERLPEVAYYRIGDDLFPDAAPGLLGYFSETRAGLIRANFSEPSSADLGFERPSQSEDAFGLQPDESIGDSLRARGFPDSEVARFDTRHEVEAKLRAGPVNFTPFVVGRFTAYDQDFEEWSPNADDAWRTWGAAGLSAATSFHHIDNSVESSIFDLHRIRHIVEPKATAWVAGANIDQGDLPPFDAEVEQIAEGSTVRVALDQTWQTQRGGAGRWRSVDVFTLDVELVANSGDTNDSAIPRYFDYRPEFSNQGDFVGVRGGWQVSDAFGLTGGTIFDLERGRQARTSIGAQITHANLFSAFADLNYVDAFDATFLSLGASYRLSDKYDVAGGIVFDQEGSEVQSARVTFTRDFPNVVLGFGVNFNNQTGETSFVFSLAPQGSQQAGLAFGGRGANSPRQRGTSFGG